MSDLKPLLNSLLKENRITLAQLNNPKNTRVKREILRELMAVAIIDSKQKSKKGNPLVGESLKSLRSTGIKFSNEQGRSLFNQGTEKKYKSSYATRLKSTYKPNPEKLPYIETATVRGGFLYAARIYLKDTKKRKHNDKKIPFKTKEGRVIKLTSSTHYAKTGKYAFWSDEPISKQNVIQLFKDLFKGKDTELVNELVVDTSNTSDIDFKLFTPVAFLYTGAIRT